LVSSGQRLELLGEKTSTQKLKQAIDLMLEDLHTKHHEIRVRAWELGCNEELEDIKFQLVNYLCGLKK